MTIESLEMQLNELKEEVQESLLDPDGNRKMTSAKDIMGESGRDLTKLNKG